MANYLSNGGPIPNGKNPLTFFFYLFDGRDGDKFCINELSTKTGGRITLDPKIKMSPQWVNAMWQLLADNLLFFDFFFYFFVYIFFEL